MKLKFLLKIFFLVFMGCLYAKSYAIEKKNRVNEERTFITLKDCVYGECPCGHPAVNNFGECSVPNCPYYYGRRDD